MIELNSSLQEPSTMPKTPSVSGSGTGAGMKESVRTRLEYIASQLNVCEGLTEQIEVTVGLPVDNRKPEGVPPGIAGLSMAISAAVVALKANLEAINGAL